MQKKTKILLTIGAFFVALILLTGGLIVYAHTHSLGFSEGLYLKADNGTSLIIIDNSPIQISDRKGRDLFEDLTDGDTIRILHDGILESYPGRTGVYWLKKLSDGQRTDIPADVIESLTGLLWLKAEAESTPEGAGNIAADTVFDIRLSYANYSDTKKLWDDAENAGSEHMSIANYLPLLKLDSAADLSAFKTNYGTGDGALSMDRGYNEVPSFNENTADYDDTFFADHTLMVVYVSAISGSYRYGVESIFCDGEIFSINVEKTNDPDIHTDDMAGWFLTVAVPRTMADGCNSFDAKLI